MRNKVVELMLDNKDEFISGEEISKQLGISRTAIWKHINSLKEEGYEIEAVNRKGYRLVSKPQDVLTHGNVAYKLDTKFIGREIIYLDTVDSTNNYIKNIASEKSEGTVVISEEQTMGRGRVGRQWKSLKGEGIWMSILLKPQIMPHKAPFITLIAGASITKALNNLGIKTEIKWPNDIIINNKKIAGILTELSSEIESINYVVVGMGINVKTQEFSEDIKDIATSIYKEGYENSRIDIVRNILVEFERLYSNYVEHNDKKEIMDICRKYSAIIGKNIYTIQGEDKNLVKCLDMNDDGNLLVEESDGNVREILSGEVSIRGVKGYV